MSPTARTAATQDPAERWAAWCAATGVRPAAREEGAVHLRGLTARHARELEVLARGVRAGVFRVTADTLDGLAAIWRGEEA